MTIKTKQLCIKAKFLQRCNEGPEFNIFLSGSSDIFVSTVGNLSDKYDLSFTPAGFTFSIWSIIYIWLAVAIGFCKYKNK